MQKRIGSQCKAASMGEIQWNLLTPVKSLAAEFWTIWRFCTNLKFKVLGFLLLAKTGVTSSLQKECYSPMHPAIFAIRQSVNRLKSACTFKRKNSLKYCQAEFPPIFTCTGIYFLHFQKLGHTVCFLNKLFKKEETTCQFQENSGTE